MMKRGVKARNLGQGRLRFHDRAYGRKIGGLVKRGQGNEFLELGQNIPVDQRRAGEP
jgi:hypothetical protein